jgi:hypothetical protein
MARLRDNYEEELRSKDREIARLLKEKGGILAQAPVSDEAASLRSQLEQERADFKDEQQQQDEAVTKLREVNDQLKRDKAAAEAQNAGAGEASTLRERCGELERAAEAAKTAHTESTAVATKATQQLQALKAKAIAAQGEARARVAELTARLQAKEADHATELESKELEYTTQLKANETKYATQLENEGTQHITKKQEIEEAVAGALAAQRAAESSLAEARSAATAQGEDYKKRQMEAQKDMERVRKEAAGQAAAHAEEQQARVEAAEGAVATADGRAAEAATEAQALRVRLETALRTAADEDEGGDTGNQGRMLAEAEVRCGEVMAQRDTALSQLAVGRDQWKKEGAALTAATRQQQETHQEQTESLQTQLRVQGEAAEAAAATFNTSGENHAAEQMKTTTTIHELKESHAQLQRTLEEKHAAQENQMQQEMQQETTRLTRLLEELGAEKLTWATSLAALEAAKQSLRVELDAGTQAGVSDLQGLEEELKEASVTIQELQVEADTLRQDTATQQAEWARQEEELKTKLSTEVGQHDDTRRVMGEEWSAAEKEWTRKETTYRRQLQGAEEGFGRLQGECRTAMEVENKARNRISALEVEQTRLQSEAETLRGRLEQRDKNDVDMQHEGDREKTNMKIALNEAKAQVQGQQALIEKLQADVFQRSARDDDTEGKYRKDLTVLEQKLKAATSETNRLRDHLKDLADEGKDVEDAAHGRQDELEQEIRQLHLDAAAMASLGADYSELQTDFDSKEKEYLRTSQALENLQGVLEQFQEQHQNETISVSPSNSPLHFLYCYHLVSYIVTMLL